MSDGDVMGGALGSLRADVHEAARGVIEQFDRKYWLTCAREQRFTDDLWGCMADLGLLGLGVPEEYGGSGGGVTAPTAAMEAMSAAGIPLALYLLTGFAREAILRHGSPEQCERFVRPTTTGESRMCFAITEPNAGTNSFAMETLAQKTPDGTYRMNGSKIFISGVDASDRMMVVTRTTRLSEVAERRQGLSLFVLDVDTPGLTFHPLDIGIVMPDRQFSVFFDDVEVEADRLVGEEGEGFRYMFDALNPERIMGAAWAIGLGDYVLGKAVGYARDRGPFGRPIGGYQALQHPLAQSRAELDAARLMMYAAAEVFDAGGNAGYLANAAKLLGSQAAVEACDHAIQTHGGYAFDADYDVSTVWPAVRLLKIAPINNEMILNYIGEHVLRLPRSY